MKKYADYLILPEFRLILECCKGKALVKDAINMKKAELSDALYSPGYDIIVDFREFDTILDSNIYESTTNFFDFLKVLKLKGRIAIVTAAPHQVVISMILKNLNKSGSGKMEVFSTMEAAAKFIGIPNDKFDFINNKVLELNKRTA